MLHTILIFLKYILVFSRALVLFRVLIRLMCRPRHAMKSPISDGRGRNGSNL